MYEHLWTKCKYLHNVTCCIRSISFITKSSIKEILNNLLVKILFFIISIINNSVETIIRIKGSTNKSNSIKQFFILGHASVPHPSFLLYKKIHQIGTNKDNKANRNIRFKYVLLFFFISCLSVINIFNIYSIISDSNPASDISFFNNKII